MDRPAYPKKNRGLTLAEVMIAMAIFAFSAVAIAGLTYYITVSANDAVSQNTAIVMAQGYLEQLCRLPYNTETEDDSSTLYGLVNIADDTAGNTVPIYLTNATGGSITNKSGGNFGNGSWSSETVYLDRDKTGSNTFPMTFEFQPELSDLSTTTSGNATGVEITLNFKATYTLGVTRTFQGSLHTVRSTVTVE